MLRALLPTRRSTDVVGPITVTLKKRGVDGYGSGAFKASRGGTKKHNGIDYAAPEKTMLFSPVDGKVTKLGYPYSDDLSYRYVEVTTLDGLKHRLFYIAPCVNIGDAVHKSTVLGQCQNISARYDVFLMRNHVHYEIMKSKTEFINPEK